MQPPPPLYGAPPGYRSANTKNVVWIVLGVVAGVLLLCCVGGGALIWRAGLGNAVKCSDLTTKGQYHAAIPYCRAVVQQLPQSGAARNDLGWCLVLDGQVQEGLAECRTAVQLEPLRNHYDSLAMALALSGQGREALQIESDHVLVNGNVANDSQRVTLGMVYYSVGQKTDAHKEWEIARTSPDSSASRLAAEFESKHP